MKKNISIITVNGNITNSCLLFTALLFLSISTTYGQFVHPGITNKKSDLDRIKYMVQAKINPWYASYQEMVADSKSSYGYVVQGDKNFTELGRDSRVNYNAWNSDIRAAYYNAIRWYVTEDERHAEKAVEIFNAWKNLTNVTSGGTDALSGGVAYIMIEAAEIIKSTYAGWKADDIQEFKDMLVYPGYSRSVAPNGNKSFYWMSYQGDPIRHGNQGLSGFRTVMAIGIFLDNEIIYERALRNIQGLPHRPDDLPYPSGPNKSTSISASNDFADTYNISKGYAIEDYGYNEVMTNYIYENGQCQESSRDHQHTVYGIGNLTSMAEMAWNQGDDLYSHANSRLLLGLEYNMRYNVSAIKSYPDQTSPWKPTVESGEFIQGFDRTGRWYSKAMSTTGEGDFSDVRPVFEMPIAHYYGRGFKTADEVKWITRARDVAIEKSGYEKEGWSNDAIGWGALTSRRPKGCYGEPINGFDSNGLPSYAVPTLPEIIEAENFDYSPVSGEGRTYHEISENNEGGAYRVYEAVDIENCSEGGYNITAIKQGEWLTYTLHAPSNGLYKIAINYAAANNNGTIKFNFNNADTTSDIQVPFGTPNSTGLTDWKDVTIIDHVKLSKGVQSLKVLFNGEDDAFKLNHFKISLVEEIPEEVILIQAEDYSDMEGVRTEDTDDKGGGVNVGYIDENDWMEYDLETEYSGDYTISYRVASKNGGGAVTLFIDENNKETLAIESTGAWQNWETITSTVSLTKGHHKIKLHSSSGGWNINWLQLELESPELLSVHDLDKNNSIQLYPNPVSNKLTVLLPSTQVKEYKIRDMYGAIRQKELVSTLLKPLVIDVSSLSNGIYLITLKSDNSNETLKFIKN